MGSGPTGGPGDHPAVQYQTLTGKDEEDNAAALKMCMAGFYPGEIIAATDKTPARQQWLIGYDKT